MAISNSIQYRYPQWGESVSVSVFRDSLIENFLRNKIAEIPVVGGILESMTRSMLVENNPLPPFIDSSDLFPSAPGLGKDSLADLRVTNRVNDAYMWKKELVRSAKHSIEVSFNYAGGEKLEEFLALIEERMQECPQLRAHIIVNQDLLSDQNYESLRNLQDRYNGRFQHLITKDHFVFSPEFISEGNHVKLLVVDEKYFVTGGSGINARMTQEDPDGGYKATTFRDSLLDESTRDTDLIGCGPIASTMRQQFFNLYRKWEYRTHQNVANRVFALDCNEEEKGVCDRFHQQDGKLVREASARLVISGAEHRANNPITHEMIYRIDEAEREIRIGNFFFNPLSALRESIERAKARGVKVVAYVNGTPEGCTFGHYCSALQARGNYDLVTEAYEHQITNQNYHKKVATIDGRISVIGSYNMSFKSQMADDEIVVVVENEDLAQQVNAGLKEDEDRAVLIKGEDLDIDLSRRATYVAATTLVTPFT